MGKKASKEHDEALQAYIEEAIKEGKRIINLNDKSPDIIEVFLENDVIKMNVIDIMHTSKLKSKAWNENYHAKTKRDSYKNLGFDEVKILMYTKDTKRKFQKMVSELMPYICKQCGYEFQKMSEYQSHIYHEHTKKKIK
ncbi:MAG: hypothetical protein ACREBB_00390 [Nitrosotalea sp.]